MPSTWTHSDLLDHFDLFLNPYEGDAWSAYELADAIDRCNAPIEVIGHALAPIGGLDQPDRHGMTVLMATCAVSDYPTQAVVRLLDHTDSSRSYTSSVGYSRTALGYALMRAEVSVDLVDALLAHGVDPTVACSGRHDALQEAVERGHVAVVAYLAHRGHDPLVCNDTGLCALDLALRKASTDEPLRDALVLALLERRPDLSAWTSGVDPDGWPWHHAALTGVDALQALIDAGLPLNQRHPRTNETALHRRMNVAYSALRSGDKRWPGHRAAIMAMLDQGMEVNDRIAMHETLWWPVFSGAAFNVELCDLLIRAGLPFDATIRDDDRSPMRNLVESRFGTGSAELYRLEQAELARAWQETLPTDPTPGVPRPRL